MKQKKIKSIKPAKALFSTSFINARKEEKHKAGVLWIEFENISDDKIQDIIAEFYLKNEKAINGMNFEQLDTPEIMVEGKKEAHKIWESPDKRIQVSKADCTVPSALVSGKERL